MNKNNHNPSSSSHPVFGNVGYEAYTTDPITGRKPLLVVGIGNLVLQDEGFGIHVIQALEQRKALPEWVDLLDGGCAGLHLMGVLQNYDHVIVVDGSLDSYPKGTVRRLHPKFGEFPPLITVHEIGLKDVIEALSLTGYCPEIEMVVCSVSKYDSLGTSLTPPVEKAIDSAVEEVINAVTEYGQAAGYRKESAG